jgi:hypothetical protein
MISLRFKYEVIFKRINAHNLVLGIIGMIPELLRSYTPILALVSSTYAISDLEIDHISCNIASIYRS